MYRSEESYGVGAPGDDRRDYCEDCSFEWHHCRCADDPVAHAVQDVERAIDDLVKAIAVVGTTDAAHRLYLVTSALEQKFSVMASAALQREDALCA